MTLTPALQNIIVNTLNEFSFIAGTTQTINFEVFDIGGSSVSLTSINPSWKMSYLGQTGSAIIVKSGSITGANSFSITLNTVDTINLSGKFIHQPILTIGAEQVRTDQGIITIIPAVR